MHTNAALIPAQEVTAQPTTTTCNIVHVTYVETIDSYDKLRKVFFNNRRHVKTVCKSDND